jgi:aminocarboxymuconate-semialdehyde decarboxylase
MLTLDLHTHILPPQWPDFSERTGYGGWLTLEPKGPDAADMVIDGKFFRAVEPNLWDPALRIEQMDATGVDVQSICTVPVMFNYWSQGPDGSAWSQLLNDHIASVVADHPRRFIGLGTLPLQDPALAVDELERCVDELGMAGVQIGSHINDWDLDAPELFPVFEAAADLGAAVFVHPWEMVGRERMDRYWLPWLVGMPAETALAMSRVIFSGLLQKLPALRVCFAHGGGSFPGTFGRIQHGFDVRPDLVALDNPVSPRDQLGRFWVDSLVHDADMLSVVVDLFGEDRVALGSDFPFPLGEAVPGTTIDSLPELSSATRALLRGGAALEFLGRDAADFSIEGTP